MSTPNANAPSRNQPSHQPYLATVRLPLLRICWRFLRSRLPHSWQNLHAFKAVVPLSITCLLCFFTTTLSADPSQPPQTDPVDQNYAKPSDAASIMRWTELAEIAGADPVFEHPPSSNSKLNVPPLPNLGQFAINQNRHQEWLSQSTEPSSPDPYATSLSPTHKQRPALTGDLIKLPGFIVPIEYQNHHQQKQVRAFFLVPKFGAILFEAAPPQTQIVYVTLEEPQSFENIMEAYWVTGKLQAKATTKHGTTAQFSMKGVSVERY